MRGRISSNRIDIVQSDGNIAILAFPSQSRSSLCCVDWECRSKETLPIGTEDGEESGERRVIWERCDDRA